MVYSVLTYIFDKYELLRDAPKNSYVEYICVTNNPNLQSNTWKIIVDKDLLDKDPLYASFYVRYHPFKYCNSSICVRIDGSIKINKTLHPIIERFNNLDSDICIMTNSRAYTIEQELKYWGFQINNKEEQKEYYKSLGVNITEEGCIQSPFSITRNNELCNKCDNLCWEMIKKFTIDGKTARPSQVIMTVAISLTKNLKIMFVNEKLIQSKLMQWYHHNSELYIRKSLRILKHSSFFGTPIKIEDFSQCT